MPVETKSELIRCVPPSAAMCVAFPAYAKIADRLGYEHDSWISRYSSSKRNEIDSRRVGPLECLLVSQASRHTDPDFFWSALWVLRTCGHRIHADDKFRNPTLSQAEWLTASSVVLLDVRKPHWTTVGRGCLVVASFEFATEPTDHEVTNKIEQIMQPVARLRACRGVHI